MHQKGILTGDASSEVERSLAASIPKLTMLKVGHHGSRTSTSRELLEVARPALALVPVGDGNRFGHPHPAVTLRLDDAGVDTYRTDRDGDVRVILRSSGDLEVRPER